MAAWVVSTFGPAVPIAVDAVLQTNIRRPICLLGTGSLIFLPVRTISANFPKERPHKLPNSLSSHETEASRTRIACKLPDKGRIRTAKCRYRHIIGLKTVSEPIGTLGACRVGMRQRGCFTFAALREPLVDPPILCKCLAGRDLRPIPESDSRIRHIGCGEPRQPFETLDRRDSIGRTNFDVPHELGLFQHSQRNAL